MNKEDLFNLAKSKPQEWIDQLSTEFSSHNDKILDHIIDVFVQLPTLSSENIFKLFPLFMENINDKDKLWNKLFYDIIINQCSPLELYTVVRERIHEHCSLSEMAFLITFLGRVIIKINAKANHLKPYKLIYIKDMVMKFIGECDLRLGNVPPADSDMDELKEAERMKEQSDKRFIHFVDPLIGCTSEMYDHLSGLNMNEHLPSFNYLLKLCFAILARVSSIENTTFDLSPLYRIIESRQLVSILEYSLNYKSYQKFQEEVQDIFDLDDIDYEEDDDEMEDYSDEEPVEKWTNFVKWDEIGVGCYLFSILVDGASPNRVLDSCFCSSQFIFQMSLPYIRALTLSGIPPLSLKGLQLLDVCIHDIPNNSISIVEKRSKQPSHFDIDSLQYYFSTIQILINFMAACPVNTLRTKAYNLMNVYISKFVDLAKFDMLKGTLEVCPFPELKSFFLRRLKEEIALEHDAILRNMKTLSITSKPYEPRKAPFIGKVPENFVPTTENHDDSIPILDFDHQTKKNLRLHSSSSIFLHERSINLLLETLKLSLDVSLDNAGILLQGINIYYFLLLRDVKVQLLFKTKHHQTFQDTILSKVEEKWYPVIETLENTSIKLDTNKDNKMEDDDEEEEEEEDGESDIDTDELFGYDLEELGLTQEEIDLLSEEAQKRKKINDLGVNIKYMSPQDRQRLCLNALMIKSTTERIQQILS